jgi:hypothetical protein
MIEAVNQFECVGGCGQGGNDAMTLIIGVVGLLVALTSAILAWRAMASSKKSAESASASLRIAEEQHKIFMKEQSARAKLELRIDLVGHPDLLVETNVSRIKLVWTLGIRNVGDKAATHVSVQWFAPLGLTELKWDTAPEESLATQRSGPWNLSQSIDDSDGETHPVYFITKIVDWLGIRGAWRYSNASAYLTVPPNAGEELKIPVLLVAASDDLGRDTPQERLESEIVVRRIR